MEARRASALAMVALVAGCEGITIEIAEPDDTSGGHVIVGWDVELELADPAACPRPEDRGPVTGALWAPAGEAQVPVSLSLAPDRYVVRAIGRDATCMARYYGQSCFGPEPPPRVVTIPTCSVAGATCLGLVWTDGDRAALACGSMCNAGRCE